MTTPIDTDQLPAVLRDFLPAHVARDDGALRAFAPDAVVTDEGRTLRGPEEIGPWLRDAGTEFTYTTDVVGAERVDDDHWVAVLHLEGDFPGGVVDLRYRFTLRDGLVTELAIAP
ncbi:nuclear transport factor 2 family protein [Nocardioides sp. CFH 31398]|uniref:nuclear transport factor 2 family protein n=1 Tax=Nocardioides sp. CFH 31398 TaxID=2919579 RepID=UPI001F06D6C8|nr:nuclear transport factor 2 family protein [Nocardioides sp. CFH 31398]MCH1868539.1 nuclear transport factor 2 family protein [Nocardioides sp. CFH 31398]